MYISEFGSYGFGKKMNTPHDPSCHEDSKKVYFVHVRNLEGQNHPEHTVYTYTKSTVDVKNANT